MKRLFVGLFAGMFVMLCCAPISFASEDVIRPYYTYTLRIVADLSISSSGSANVTASFQGASSENSSEVFGTLQRKVIGQTNWSNVKPWHDSGSGRQILKISDSVSVQRGYAYRVRVRGKIKSPSGAVLEEPTKYSSVVNFE